MNVQSNSYINEKTSFHTRHQLRAMPHAYTSDTIFNRCSQQIGVLSARTRKHILAYSYYLLTSFVGKPDDHKTPYNCVDFPVQDTHNYETWKKDHIKKQLLKQEQEE